MLTEGEVRHWTLTKEGPGQIAGRRMAAWSRAPAT
ncbi:MAG: hypothetical protein ACI8QZ_002700 [Chlamydiales bacterium]|jgi:hypothetical protein